MRPGSVRVSSARALGERVVRILREHLLDRVAPQALDRRAHEHEPPRVEIDHPDDVGDGLGERPVRQLALAQSQRLGLGLLDAIELAEREGEVLGELLEQRARLGLGSPVEPRLEEQLAVRPILAAERKPQLAHPVRRAFRVCCVFRVLRVHAPRLAREARAQPRSPLGLARLVRGHDRGAVALRQAARRVFERLDETRGGPAQQLPRVALARDPSVNLVDGSKDVRGAAIGHGGVLVVVALRQRPE